MKLKNLLFVAAFIPAEERPYFFQLNYGYRISPKNALVVEARTWTYYKPVGIAYGKSGDSYPGKIRAWGMGLG